ncbi:hypothetical protein AC1031_014007 [Aphanomyces cochlioides]|nr:hypothetical protein AC1031_014007 [Aphanomyces cochlioides]
MEPPLKRRIIHLDVVKELLAHGASIEAADNSCLTPLITASGIGHLDVVKELLAHGALIEAANKDGWTPLITASSFGHLAVVKELLAHGASIEAADNRGNTPLHNASRDGNLEILKVLLNAGASSERENSFGQSARDCGNDKAKAFLHNLEIYSITSATEDIRQAIEKFKTTTSDIAAQGIAIMRLSLNIQVHHQGILTTGLMRSTGSPQSLERHS